MMHIILSMFVKILITLKIILYLKRKPLDIYESRLTILKQTNSTTITLNYIRPCQGYPKLPTSV